MFCGNLNVCTRNTHFAPSFPSVCVFVLKITVCAYSQTTVTLLWRMNWWDVKTSARPRTLISTSCPVGTGKCYMTSNSKTKTMKEISHAGSCSRLEGTVTSLTEIRAELFSYAFFIFMKLHITFAFAENWAFVLYPCDTFDQSTSQMFETDWWKLCQCLKNSRYVSLNYSSRPLSSQIKSNFIYIAVFVP